MELLAYCAHLRKANRVANKRTTRVCDRLYRSADSSERARKRYGYGVTIHEHFNYVSNTLGFQQLLNGLCQTTIV